MSSIGAQQDVFSALGLARTEDRSAPQNDASELGLDTFLKLMITQLNNQDPFKPMENGEFLGQIAQFSSVTGLDKLNNQFESLSASLTSGQALQAGAVVGRDVLVPTSTSFMRGPGEAVRGQAQLDESSSEVTVRVYDQVGQLVREMPMGSAQPGALKFTWDGMNDGGDYVPEGPYQVRVSSKQGENEVELQTELFANVESVNMSARDGLTLNLQGLGPVAFKDVKQIF